MEESVYVAHVMRNVVAEVDCVAFAARIAVVVVVVIVERVTLGV